MLNRIGFIIFAAVLSTACVKRTPVMPVPVSAEEAIQLQQALLGTCDVVSSQKEGGDVKSEDGLAFTFGQDGAGGYNALGIRLNFKYRLEGRNVLMSQGYEAFRVDDWSNGTLKLFVYDTSVTWFCRKRA